MKFVLVIAAGIAASLFAFEFLPIPFLWIFIGWTVALFMLSTRTGSTALRIVSINLAAILFVFSIGEIVYLIRAEPSDQVDSETGAGGQEQSQVAWSVAKGVVQYTPSREAYVEYHDYLGYAPLPNNEVIGRRYEGEEIVYDVVYSLDENGLRRTPFFDRQGDVDCILFFGGSFTIGEGVKGEEVAPYLVGIDTSDRYRVYNFGFHGYGPHQMLSALEHGLIDDVIDCKPKYIFFQAIRHHIKRVAGIASHDTHGPRYRLRTSGELIFDGNFDGPSNAPEDAIIRRSEAYGVLSKSFLLKEMHRISVIYTENITLLTAIVEASRQWVEDRWPDSEFHVILWNERFQPKTKQLEWVLAEQGFQLHLVGDILPGYLGNKERYWVHENDHHPNTEAHRLLADYLVNEVVGKQD